MNLQPLMPKHGRTAFAGRRPSKRWHRPFAPWFRKHPVIFTVVWVPASLALGFAVFDLGAAVYFGHAVNLFGDWAAGAVAAACSIWEALVFFVLGRLYVEDAER